MVGDVDKIALWNIVTTVDAYLSAGFTPAEILEAVHPSMVASTQGTGFGGMASMRKLYLDRFLNHEIPTDILQEALPNVVAAHVMQSYIGGYGNMIQPVSACATAAVSLEEGADKIALGKADFVVTGAIDDIGVESVIGFGNMNATANSEEMYAKGIDARFFSRANDRRRGGFVESQGGGTILLTRGDIALKLGLPVAAWSDSSTPTPTARTPPSRLGTGRARSWHGRQGLQARARPRQARRHAGRHRRGLQARHVHQRQRPERVRTAQHAGPRHRPHRRQPAVRDLAEDAYRSCQGRCLHLPGQRSDPAVQVRRDSGERGARCVDPKLQRDDHMVWVRKPLRIGGGEDEFGRETAGRPVKAGLATSLGFGHVSGFVALVHPGAFEAAVAKADGEAALEAWRERANARLAAGQRHLEEGMMGRAALYEPIDNRRFREDGTKLADAIVTTATKSKRPCC